MFTTARNTLTLLWTSLEALAKEPVFVVLGGMWSLALVTWLGTLALALEAGGSFDRIAGSGDVRVLDVGFILFGHVVACFITLYCQAASVVAAYHRLEGAYGSLGEGLEAAGDRLGAILAWGAFAGTAGFVMKRIRRGASPGASIAFLFGWARASVLVVPVMMTEAASPPAALRRAEELFFETWGSRTVPRVSFRLAYGAIALLGGLAAGAVFALAGSLTASAIAGGVIVIVLATAVRSSEAIFAVDLYAFATSGDGAIYPRRLLHQAYVTPGRSRRDVEPDPDYEQRRRAV